MAVQSGAKDVNNFRENIENGYFPISTDITYNGIFYDYLINSQNKEFAKKYLEANENAIQNIKNIIEKEEIDCDLEEKNSYVFTKQETKLDIIKNEQKSVDKLQKGKSDYIKEIELPTQISGAIEFKNQAQFHPLKYAYGLAKAIIKNDGKIYENTKVTDIKRENGRRRRSTGSPCLQSSSLPPWSWTTWPRCCRYTPGTGFWPPCAPASCPA